MVIEYFRKLYLKDLKDGKKADYKSIMRTASDSLSRQLGILYGKHSELKKPYRAKSYKGYELDGLSVGCPGCEPVPGDGTCCFNIHTKLICEPQDCVDNFGTEFGVFRGAQVLLSLTITCLEQWVIRCGKKDFCAVICGEPDCKTGKVNCKPSIWTVHSCGNQPGMIVKGAKGVIQRPYGVFDFTKAKGNFEVCCDCGKACGGAGCCAKVEIVDLCITCSADSDCEISGSDTMATSDTQQLSSSGTACAGLTWCVDGEDVSVSPTGLVTTGSSACGAITVTLKCGSCSGTVVDTFNIRVTDAGHWVGPVYCNETSAPCSCCPNCGCAGPTCTVEVGIYKYAQIDCWTLATGSSNCTQECCGGHQTMCDSKCTTSDPYVASGGGANCGVIQLRTWTWECV